MDVSVISHHDAGGILPVAEQSWSIRVVLSNESEYFICRSFLEFVTIDEVLKKKFPNSNLISPLPFTDTEKQNVTKVILDDMKATNKRDSITNSSPRKQSSDSSPIKLSSPSKSSITSEDLKSVLRDTDSPDMNTYTPLLDQYIKQFLSVPEILSCIEIVNFFHDTSIDILTGPSTNHTDKQPVSIHDVLFETCKTKTVKINSGKKEKIEIDCKNEDGGVVVWEFATKEYDIGFYIEIDGNIQIPFSRCNSHIKSVRGQLKVIHPCTISLVFDNSYAKMRAKQLYLQLCSIDHDRIPELNAAVLNIETQTRDIQIRRLQLQKSISDRCIEICGYTSVFLSSTELASATLETSYNILKNEYNTLESEFKHQKKELLDSRIKCKSLENNLDEDLKIKIGLESALNQEKIKTYELQNDLDTTLVDLAASVKTNSELNNTVEENNKNINDLTLSLEKSQSDTKKVEQEKLELIKKLSKAEAEIVALKGSNQSMRSDLKKQKDILHECHAHSSALDDICKKLNSELSKSH